MCSGLLVVTLRELADQLLEDVTHVDARNLVGTEVGFRGAELLDDQVKQSVIGQLVNLLLEIHAVDDVDDVLREVVQIRLKVVLDVVRVGQQRLEGETAQVVELLSGRPLQEAALHLDFLLVQLLVGLQDLFTSGCQCVFKTFDDAHGKNDVPVLVGLVDSHQLICYRPNQVGFLLHVDRGLLLSVVYAHSYYTILFKLQIYKYAEIIHWFQGR